MRKGIIAGNWKMHKNIEETKNLIEELKQNLQDIIDVDILICPSFTSLYIASEILKGSNIKLGAQNMYFEEKGAYTGEISPLQLKDIGCEYVIIGHSERRHIFGEKDKDINKKLKSALKFNLIPILCVGETLKEREENMTSKIVTTQTKLALQGIDIDDAKKIIFAYEPVWAIGTGKNATAEDANSVIKIIRNVISELYNENTGNEIRVQYGGSVKPDNIKEFSESLLIDGVLVGGASLNATSYSEIVKMWSI